MHSLNDLNWGVLVIIVILAQSFFTETVVLGKTRRVVSVKKLPKNIFTEKCNILTSFQKLPKNMGGQLGQNKSNPKVAQSSHTEKQWICSNKNLSNPEDEKT